MSLICRRAPGCGWGQGPPQPFVEPHAPSGPLAFGIRVDAVVLERTLRIEAISFDDSEGHFNIDDVTLDAVPEPSAAVLLAGGLVGMAVRWRRSGIRADL